MRGATAKRPIGSRIARISIHAPHAGRDCQAAHREPYCTNFNPRAPCGARLDVLFLHALTRCDFNPRAPCGARRFRYVTVAFVWSFQSTRPMRGATFYILPTMRARDISIHAPHAGRDAGDKYITGSNCISIHAPRAGRDQGRPGGVPADDISIHAPRAGRDRARSLIFPHLWKFQSTRPVRGATTRKDILRHEWEFQSTRPVRGATPAEVYCTFSYTISIHAPRAGRDAGRDVVRPGEHISIHAPRAGRD